jgi:hypothetical protein
MNLYVTYTESTLGDLRSRPVGTVESEPVPCSTATDLRRHSVTDAKAVGPARTYQKSSAVLATRCTPNTGKGSPAARILSLFETVTPRPQLTINRVRAH